MPPYQYLFYKRNLKLGEKASPDAVKVEGGPAGCEILPSDEASQLAAYLLSLRSEGILFETPPPAPPPTNSAAKATPTNAPAAKPATNAPAK
jgi:hypothetical protein